MAKIPYSKLNLKINTDVSTFSFNGFEIEIKEYLPLEEKLNIITNILNNSVNDKGYYNVGQLQMFTELEIIFNYTNITFTEKQKENITKLYDILSSSGLIAIVLNNLEPEEYTFIYNTTKAQIENIYKYRNSVVGVLDTISTDYSNLNLNIDDLQKKLANGENIELLKEIMDKLG